jgi:hypothetical protein
MLPITNQLDRITGDASGINTIAQAQERTPDHVDTSGVMSADRVADVGQGLDAQAKAGLHRTSRMLINILADKPNQVLRRTMWARSVKKIFRAFIKVM